MAKEKSKIITHIIYYRDHHGDLDMESGYAVTEGEDLDICVERFALEFDIETRSIEDSIRIIKVKSTSVLVPTPGKFTYTEVPQ